MSTKQQVPIEDILSQFAGLDKVDNGNGRPVQTHASTLSAEDMKKSLGDSGEIKLGIIDQFRVNNSISKGNREASIELADRRKEELVKLVSQQIEANASVIRETLRVKFQAAYAHVAEMAAAGEIRVVRRFEALFTSVREILFDDRNDYVRNILERFKNGNLSEEEARREIAFREKRLSEILMETEEIIGEKKTRVRNAYRNQPSTQENHHD